MTTAETRTFTAIGSDGSYFQASDGSQLYFYQTGNGKSPMLFLHTLRTQAEYHHKMIVGFEGDYDCIATDWPGHGRSSKEADRAYDAEYMIGQIIEFIKVKQLTELVVVGESIGATAALALAARIPDRIKSVYASNPFDAGLIIGKPAGRAVSWLGARVSAVTRDEVRPITKFVIGGGFADRAKLEDRFVDLISSNAKNNPEFGHVFHSVLAHQKSWHQVRKSDYPKIPNSIPVTLMYSHKDWSSGWVVCRSW